MSKENVRKFYESASTNVTLIKELEEVDRKIKVSKADFTELKNLIKSEIIPMAQKNGFDFTAEELLDCVNERYLELSDEDLMGVTGGLSTRSTAIGLSAVLLLSMGATAAVQLMTPNNDLSQVISRSVPASNQKSNRKISTNIDNSVYDNDAVPDQSTSLSSDVSDASTEHVANVQELLKNKRITLPSDEDKMDTSITDDQEIVDSEINDNFSEDNMNDFNIGSPIHFDDLPVAGGLQIGDIDENLLEEDEAAADDDIVDTEHAEENELYMNLGELFDVAEELKEEVDDSGSVKLDTNEDEGEIEKVEEEIEDENLDKAGPDEHDDARDVETPKAEGENEAGALADDAADIIDTEHDDPRDVETLEEEVELQEEVDDSNPVRLDTNENEDEDEGEHDDTREENVETPEEEEGNEGGEEQQEVWTFQEEEEGFEGEGELNEPLLVPEEDEGLAIAAEPRIAEEGSRAEPLADAAADIIDTEHDDPRDVETLEEEEESRADPLVVAVEPQIVEEGNEGGEEQQRIWLFLDEEEENQADIGRYAIGVEDQPGIIVSLVPEERNIPQGLKIEEFEYGSPDEWSQLQYGDIITHINGDRMNNGVDGLDTALSKSKHNEDGSYTVELRVYRVLADSRSTTFDFDLNFVREQNEGNINNQEAGDVQEAPAADSSNAPGGLNFVKILWNKFRGK